MRNIINSRLSPLLSDKPIATLLFSVVFSRFGYGCYFIGLTWHLAQSGDTWRVAYLVLALTIPGVVVGPLTGGIIDRKSRRAILLTMELAQGLMCGVILAILYGGHSYLTLLCAVSLCASFREIYVIAQRVYLAELSENADLLALNGFVSMAGQIGGASGALIGGIVAATNPFTTVGIYGFLLLLSGALLYACLKISHVHDANVSDAGRSFSSDMHTALVFLREKPLVSASYFLAVLSLGVLPIFNTSLPIFVARATNGGSAEYGMIDAAFGVGGAAACLYGAKLNAFSPKHMSLLGTVVLAFSLYAITIAPTVTLIAVASLVAGFSFFSWLGHLTDGQTSTPKSIQGRVMAFFEASYATVAVLFLLTLNILVETIGVATVIQSYSLILFLAACLIWFLKKGSQR